MATTRPSINVLVTGFGPFPNFHGGVYEKNSSHLVTTLLPSSLAPSHPLNPTSCTINLINPTALQEQYVKVSYAYIRSYASELHDKHKQDVDLFVHLGMADGWDHVTVERRAYKQGFSSDWWKGLTEKEYYTLKDVEGETVSDAAKCPWGKDVPVGLSTDMNVDAVVERVRGLSAALGQGAGGEKEGWWDMKEGCRRVEAHHEAGSYCCGFLFYESLANSYVRGSRVHVMFCHVPGETDEVSLTKAKNSILAIIGAAVEDLLRARDKQGVEEDLQVEDDENESWIVV